MSTLPPSLQPRFIHTTADMLARAQADIARMQAAVAAEPDHQPEWFMLTINDKHAQAYGSGTTTTAINIAITALEYALRHAQHDLRVEAAARLTAALAIVTDGRQVQVDAMLIRRHTGTPLP